MNARSYRVELNVSPLDFQVKAGMTESSLSYQSEPFMLDGKVKLAITNKYMLNDMYNNTNHQALSVESIYEIPVNELKTREGVYELYTDSISGLNECYQSYQKDLPDLPNIIFPNPPIEAYKSEIDRVFDLLNRQN